MSGRITLDGKNLTSGAVTFHPVEKGTVAMGEIKPDGSYSVSAWKLVGLPPGDYVVTVVAYDPDALLMPSDDPDEPTPPKPITPLSYGMVKTSPLHFTVKPGSNPINLELKTEAAVSDE